MSIAIQSADFDLSDFIREYLTASGEPSPHRLAEEIAAGVPVQHLRAALADALPHLVREEVRQARDRTYAATPPTSPKTVAPQSDPRRLAAQAFDSVYYQREHTGKEWKLLGDCDPDDLLAIARTYRRREAESAAGAKKRERLARKLKRKQGASVVRDLSVEEVLRVLS